MLFSVSMHVYRPLLLLTVPVPTMITTPSRTTPLYAGTSVTLSCIVTLHPNVDSGEIVVTVWITPLGNQYSDNGIHRSGKIYTHNITISPLHNRHSGRYVCAVNVTRRNAQQASNTSVIDITVRSKLSIIYESFYSIPACFYTALPRQPVTISHASGSPTAGQPYSLTCSVEAVPHLVVDHGILWTRQDGRPIEPSSVNNPQLIFKPLMTSNGSHYTCRAIANISNVISDYGSNSTSLVAYSELSFSVYGYSDMLTEAMIINVFVMSFYY